MKKYKVGQYGRIEIEEIEVVRETEHYVYLPPNQWRKKEFREAKASSIFDTWEAAHAHLMQDAEADVMSARRRLELANAKLGNVKGMKKP